LASLKELRNRIASVKATQKITKAMQMVAAAKLRLAQDQAQNARPYAQRMAAVIANLAAGVSGAGAPRLLVGAGEDQNQLVVVATSDRGLAGGFNANIFRAAQRFMTERKQADPPAREVTLEVVGKKGRDYFRRRKLEVARETAAPTADTVASIARDLAHIVSHAFRESRTDAVFLVYNEFKSAVQQQVVIEPLLPVSGADLPGAADAAAGGVLDFIYEPSKAKLLDALLPLYVESQLYRGLLESIASELGARMTAMDNATNNAREMIASLTLQYNRARQAAITKELMEIVSGAEALKG
jgi:F-type H+-transporting ATPase subunit gamma